MIGRITVFDTENTYDINIHLTIDLPGWHGREAIFCPWTDGDAFLPLSRRDRNSHVILAIDVKAAGRKRHSYRFDGLNSAWLFGSVKHVCSVPKGSKSDASSYFGSSCPV
ncbi:outer membrane protein [Gluconobacter japonicus]|nr:outer membrane protein [Gluconobacter japonicus]